MVLLIRMISGILPKRPLNDMASYELTKRENEIVERIAWGASQKEIADDLGISRCTVDNILRKAKAKLRLSKINEISAWWFCTNFNISFELSPLARQIGASILIILFTTEYLPSKAIRTRRVRNVRTEVRVTRNEISTTK